MEQRDQKKLNNSLQPVPVRRLNFPVPLGTKTRPNSFGTDLDKVIFARYFNMNSPRMSLFTHIKNMQLPKMIGLQ